MSPLGKPKQYPTLTKSLYSKSSLLPLETECSRSTTTGHTDPASLLPCGDEREQCGGHFVYPMAISAAVLTALAVVLVVGVPALEVFFFGSVGATASLTHWDSFETIKVSRSSHMIRCR